MVKDWIDLEIASVAGAKQPSLDLTNQLLVANRVELALPVRAMTMFFTPKQLLESLRSRDVQALVCESELHHGACETLSTAPICLLMLTVLRFSAVVQPFLEIASMALLQLGSPSHLNF